MKNGKVKINVRQFQFRNQGKPESVIRRRLGRFAKKRKFNPISRQLRWKRELQNAFSNSVAAFCNGTSTFDPTVAPDPVQLDLDKGYSWSVTLTANAPFP